MRRYRRRTITVHPCAGRAYGDTGPENACYQSHIQDICLGITLPFPSFLSLPFLHFHPSFLFHKAASLIQIWGLGVHCKLSHSQRVRAESGRQTIWVNLEHELLHPTTALGWLFNHLPITNLHIDLYTELSMPNVVLCGAAAIFRGAEPVTPPH